ncbi:MAG: hypothetical protein ISR98_00565 [Parcubacteria group bacterium]|nr:hypothetical protein [Parcubacteria group bacterium]
MIPTKILTKSNSADLLKKAMGIASCYGFDNIDKVSIQKKHFNNLNKENEANAPMSKKSPIRTEKPKNIKQNIKNYSVDIASDQILSTLKTIVDNGLLPYKHPLLIQQSNINKKQDHKTLSFGLVAVGIKKSIAEALILKTATAILEDIGINDIQISINSMGDKDSSSKFVSELNSYFRKNINSVPSQVRHTLKKDVFKAYNQLHKECCSNEEDIPQPIKFLSDNNRKHLSEVLEYMEIGNMPYEIDNFLIGSNTCYSQTLFEIHNVNEDNDMPILAKGGRCDELVKKMFNIDVPTVGIVFEFEKKGIKEKELNTLKRARKPKVYFIQLGSEAKRQSLSIIDTLRKSNIYTHHSLDNDKLSEQLSFAQYLKVPYAIIMGHREALDGTVIVRDMNTQFQHTVLVDDLSQYLKDIHV